MSRYKSTNPFEDDDDDDQDFVLVNKGKPAATYSFDNDNAAIPTNASQSSLSRPRQSSNPFESHNSAASSGYGCRGEEEANPFEFDDRRQRLQTQINESENRQLESAQRALASIYDSEAMGVATAEELVRQAEMLDNIENKTDGMQNTLTTSQKHINNIRSVFGGIKNWWAGKGDKKPAAKNNEQGKDSDSHNKLKAEIDKQSRYDTSGFRDDDERDLDARFMAGSSRKPGDGQYKVIEPVTRSAREDELDYNLDMMSSGMSRLKGLAQGLGDEIERQNDQLDRINLKVEDTDDLVTNQNRQIRRILKN